MKNIKLLSASIALALFASMPIIAMSEQSKYLRSFSQGLEHRLQEITDPKEISTRTLEQRKKSGEIEELKDLIARVKEDYKKSINDPQFRSEFFN
jgi:hypothetical protein